MVAAALDGAEHRPPRAARGRCRNARSGPTVLSNVRVTTLGVRCCVDLEWHRDD